MNELAGKVAVITGAGSGIGRALALALTRKKMTLALVDRDPATVAGTLDLVIAGGSHGAAFTCDVADRDAVATLARDVVRDLGAPAAVVNNAGVSLFGSVAELALDEYEWLMNINFYGTVHVTKAFLPSLVAQPAANIVNVASVYGLFAPPGNSAYAASKFAVRGFTESLRGELRSTNVVVTTVYPGGVRTNIARSARIARAADPVRAAQLTARFDRQFLVTDPGVVAAAIVRAIETDRERVVVGNSATPIDLLTRIAPTGAARYFVRQMRRFAG
jgi:short-subunit dehydrogenase